MVAHSFHINDCDSRFQNILQKNSKIIIKFMQFKLLIFF